MFERHETCQGSNCYNPTYAVARPGEVPGDPSVTNDVMALFNINGYCSIGCDIMAHRGVEA